MSWTSLDKVCGTSRNRLIHQLRLYGSPESLSTMGRIPWSPPPPNSPSAGARLIHDLWRRIGLRRRSHRGGRDRLIGGHRGGGLDPHPRIVGLVERDRNRVDTKEIRRHQHPVNHVVGGQLRQRRHRGQCRGVGGGRGLVLDSLRRAFGAGLHQPRQVRHMRSHIPLGARALPGSRLHRCQDRRGVPQRPTRMPCSTSSTRRPQPAATPGPGPLLSNAECTSGGDAIQTGAVISRPPVRSRRAFNTTLCRRCKTPTG